MALRDVIDLLGVPVPAVCSERKSLIATVFVDDRVPDGMQVLHSGVVRVRYFLNVTAHVALHVCVVDFGGTMKGLMDITDVMDNHS